MPKDNLKNSVRAQQAQNDHQPAYVDLGQIDLLVKRASIRTGPTSSAPPFATSSSGMQTSSKSCHAQDPRPRPASTFPLTLEEVRAAGEQRHVRVSAF